MKVYVAAILAALAAPAIAEDKNTLLVPAEVLSIGQVVPLIERPIPMSADALSSSAFSVVPNAPLLSSNLQATSSQIGNVVGSSISNLGQSVPRALAPAGPALTLGNAVGPLRAR
jgi:hypothetical protein